VATALAAGGRFRPALELAVHSADRLAPDDSRPATPGRLSVYGILLLQGTMAAARMGDAATVRDLIAEATEAARRLGRDDNHYWTSFGPTNVMLHWVAAEVEMGEGGRAVERSESIERTSLAAMMPERRAHHLLDTSRGLAQVGDISRAAETLVEADRLAPSEIRYRPIAQELVADLLRRTRGAPPAAITDLADHMRLTF
jgi:hypothetical protein